MTIAEFQKNHAAKLLEFLESQLGKDTVQMLTRAKPSYEMNKEEHLYIDNRGAVRGYEQCLKTLIFLAAPPTQQSSPKADYGVAEPEK